MFKDYRSLYYDLTIMHLVIAQAHGLHGLGASTGCGRAIEVQGSQARHSQRNQYTSRVTGCDQGWAWARSRIGRMRRSRKSTRARPRARHRRMGMTWAESVNAIGISRRRSQGPGLRVQPRRTAVWQGVQAGPRQGTAT